MFFIKSIEGEIVELDVYSQSDNSNSFELQYGVGRNSNQWNNYKFRFYDSEVADDKDFQEFIKTVFEAVKLEVIT